MLKYYRHSHSVPRYLGLALAVFCWIAALIQSLSLWTDQYTNVSVPAYSASSSVTESKNWRICHITDSTYEVFSKSSSITPSGLSQELEQTLDDSDLHLILSHQEPNYYDFYYYSPKLEASGIQPAIQGYNIHVAITRNGHTYLGFPQINYDF